MESEPRWGPRDGPHRHDIYFIYCGVLTRVVVEGGMMWSLAPLTPDKAMVAVAGSRAFSAESLTAIAHQMVWVRKMRWILPPSLLQTYRMMPEMRIAGPGINWLLLAILAFGAIGDVGRPDLFPDIAEELAGQLYHSLHDKLLKLPDYVEVYPAPCAG